MPRKSEVRQSSKMLPERDEIHGTDKIGINAQEVTPK